VHHLNLATSNEEELGQQTHGAQRRERALEDCHYTTTTRKPSPKPYYGGVVYNFSVTQIVDYPWPSISLPFLLKRPRPTVFDKLFFIKNQPGFMFIQFKQG
jgi:hypothetical protein